MKFKAVKMHPAHPQSYCVSLEDENGNSGTRIGGFTGDKQGAEFAAVVLRCFVEMLESDHPHIRKAVSGLLARRQRTITLDRSRGGE